MKMPSLRNLAFATATLGTLSACVPTTENQAPLTPRQAQTKTTATVGAGGAILCGFIDDRTSRSACFAAAAAVAVAAGTQANANAAARGNCDLSRSGVRGANNVVYENCRKRTPW
jgi:hypothetical protein